MYVIGYLFARSDVCLEETKERSEEETFIQLDNKVAVFLAVGSVSGPASASEPEEDPSSSVSFFLKISLKNVNPLQLNLH